jgi:GntR family transcriptional regulator
VRFQIDPRAPSPPSEQLADQVRFAVASGRLAPGDRLPSVRALAEEIRLNPNTVGRAWRDLEREGVLESRRGDGMFVAAGALKSCRAAADSLVRERLARAVAEALGAGMPVERVFEIVRNGYSGEKGRSKAS